jgi:hypothetical protein
MKAIVYTTLIGLLLLFGACKSGGLMSAHTSFGHDSAPLQAAFNADQGKVRVLMLVSPT